MQTVASDALNPPALPAVRIRRSGPGATSLGRGRVKSQDQILFCRQLATFVKVGVPITTAMQTFAEQSGSAALRRASAAMVLDLERGALLSEAIAAHPKVFPNLISDMVRAAEVTGDLDRVLRQAAKHIEREASARQKIKGAMTYPTIVASLAVVICIGLVVFVLPQFRELYKSLSVPLPGAVRFLLSVSDVVRLHWPLLVAGLAAIAGAGWAGLRTDHGKVLRDRALLRAPLVGPMLRTAITERFCRTLGDMLSAGVPITQTFPVVIDATHNRVYKRALGGVASAMAAGDGFYAPLKATGLFQPMVIQMLRVGEETGSLDMHLEEAALMYGDELDYRIKRMTAFLEPALIIFVGLMVGAISATMISAIYSLAGNYS